ncbi:MAG TPA: N-acyl homoserine lactonase family protein [Vicinamibacterales bacterium]|jgi:glyoxylase-like metal-dependent hydrolase (beta-lactamase superfamily II)|nr:N-acyl homoserine lactonase family protein [Vicinamibacterales bacterium]
MKPRIFRLLAAAALLVGASQLTAAQAKKPAPPTSLRLYVFDCGQLDIPDISPYQLTREEIATNVMSVPCFLVAHPRGTLIWDTGAVPDRSIPAGGTGTLRTYGTSKRKLEAQLTQAGYTPADITYVSFSHFHWDHVGNANLFARSTWLVRQAERDVMFADPPSPRTEPENFSALRNSRTTIITTPDYDVFGDRRVVIKAAPGHSPGHQVLFLDLAKTGPVVLSGDLYHYPEERTLKKVPTTEFNREQSAASRAAIEAFLASAHAQLWIEHDFNAMAKLNKAPAYYE